MKKFSTKINENNDDDPKMETSMEFCERMDIEEGEAWSNDYIALAEKMEEYAKYYHEYMINSEETLSFIDWIGENYPTLKNHGDSLTLSQIKNAYKEYTEQ